MDQPICKLTLVYPPDIGDSVVELMTDQHPPIAGFTTFCAQGHGFGFANATSSEKVRGRVERNVLVAVVKRDTADTLLEQIRTRLPVAHIAYWIEPVIACGRLVQRPFEVVGGQAS
ncbi:MAG: DUF3240 family protein [Hyphomicrobiaceae bacterium]